MAEKRWGVAAMSGTCAVCGADVALKPPDRMMPHRWSGLYCATARFGFPEVDFCSAACAHKYMAPRVYKSLVPA
jgi:hypothetical protein